MARHFNGTSDFLDAASTLPTTQVAAVRYACWVKFDSVAAEAVVMGNDDQDGICLEVGFNSNWGLLLSGSGRDDSGIPFSIGVWTCVVATQSSGNVGTIYVGGVAGTPSTTVANSPPGKFSVGAQWNATRTAQQRFVAGSIAEVAVWERTLRSTEAAFLAAGNSAALLPTNLVAYYPINGARPEVDQTGNGHNLTVTGTTVVAGPPWTNPAVTMHKPNHLRPYIFSPGRAK